VLRRRAPELRAPRQPRPQAGDAPLSEVWPSTLRAADAEVQGGGGVLNVANLKPEYFANIVAGRKRTEWRWRRKSDARLDAIERGEPIVLLEIGSDRCICAIVRAIMRFSYPDGYLYAIRLLNPRLGTAAGIRKIQGWQRRVQL
jgi:hypothetical protein